MSARAPEHVRQATEVQRLAMFAWLNDRERACRGHLNGEEARDYAREHPAPRYADALADVLASCRNPEPPNVRTLPTTNVVDLTDWITS
jgi:hypothetical protein